MGFGDVAAGDFGHIAAADADIERFLAQAGSAAIGTFAIAPVAAEEDADLDLILFLFHFGEKLVAEEVDEEGAFVLGEVGDGDFAADGLAVAADEARLPVVIGGLGPGGDGAGEDRKRGVGDDEIEVVVDDVAEALAAGAGAEGGVEREERRFGGLIGDPAGFAGEGLREAVAFRFGDAGLLEDDFAAFAIADFDGIDDAGADVGGNGEAVGENGEGLVEVEFEEGFRRRELADFAVLIEPVETALPDVKEVVAEFRWIFVGVDGEEGVPAGAEGELGDGFGDVVYGVLLDRLAALGAVGGAGAGEQEAEEVIDFGGGGDGGAGVTGGVLLADGDGGREAEDLVDIGLAHAVEELAGVGGEGFDVAPLAFGVDGIKDKRRLAGAGDAGDDGELIVGDVERDILEVVHPRAADGDDFRNFRFPFLTCQ